MEQATQLERHLISLYDNYTKLLLFGYTHGVTEDEYFKEHLDRLRRRHCPICDITFGSSEAAHNHKNAKHPALTQWTCVKCNKNFAQKRFLKQHEKIHTKLHRCHLCNFTCDNVHVFRAHLKLCRVTCDICDRSFSKQDTLDNHIQFHHEKVTCDDCGKQFNSRRILVIHRKRFHKIPAMAIRFSCKVSNCKLFSFSF